MEISYNGYMFGMEILLEYSVNFNTSYFIFPNTAILCLTNNVPHIFTKSKIGHE